ncbi:MAG: glycosyltransferase N-terminal domain-containing protein [bacterium]|jgi:3-deoxy-D-manno-octulosonic-acid transferase|nr:3-deoxy-D-manno-octulosonic acid transferase [Planctomycetota bacterium]HIL52123.1 3-deoxy-D-manno-octulosonic acid transferase [Planctomycetota bacterium]
MTPGSPPAPIIEDPGPGVLRFGLHVLYDTLWWLAILAGSPWWVWRAWREPAFRRMVFGRLGFDLPAAPCTGQRRRVLIHGVSVGEVKAAAALVALFEREHPELEIVLSTTTDTGVTIAEKVYPKHRVVRFPVDPTWLVRRFLRRVAPVCVVLVELEIWPNFLRSANRMGIPVAVVNGRITASSFKRYRSFRHLLPQFNRISLFCVQNEEYAARFADLAEGDERILITGNIKADGLGTGPLEVPAELRRLTGPAEGQLVLCAGSTHEPEERYLVEAWRRVAPGVRLVLVPRHPGRAESVLASLADLGVSAQLLSSLRAGARPDPSQPLVVDSIGELEGLLGLADLVFIGGSLVPHGGQNMLEPAAAGRAVIYGPHVENFEFEASLLESRGAARRLAGLEALAPALAELLEDPHLRAEMGTRGQAAVADQRGATSRTLVALQERCLLGRGHSGKSELLFPSNKPAAHRL